jgi:hypothetical protein
VDSWRFCGAGKGKKVSATAPQTMWQKCHFANFTKTNHENVIIRVIIRGTVVVVHCHTTMVVCDHEAAKIENEGK